MLKKLSFKRKGIITLFVLLFAFISLFFVNINHVNVSADTSSDSPPWDYDDLVSANEPISINYCNFVLDIHEDGNISFEQNFEVTFLHSSLTEVIFMVPYQGTIFREYNGNLQEINYLAKISNWSLELGQEGTEELRIYQDEESGFITFGIKKPNGYYKRRDTRSYTLYYDYNMWNEGVEEYDEVYINLLSGMSTMPINNVTFEINLPKPVNFESFVPYIYTGALGSSDSLVEFVVSEDGKTISSVASFDVRTGAALTYKQFLPKGYLNVHKPSSAILIISFVILLILSSIAIVLKVYGKFKQKIIAPVEVSVPEGMDPVFAEYLYKDKLTTKVFPAVIVYLANLKYIKIIEDEDNDIIKLIKLKDLQNPKEENEEIPNSIRRFYKDIFRHAKINDDGLEEIVLDNIDGRHLYDNFENMKREQENLFKKEGYIKEKKSIQTTIIVSTIFSILSIIIGLILQFKYMIGIIPNMVWGCIFVCGFMSIFIAVGLYVTKSEKRFNLVGLSFCFMGILAAVGISFTLKALPNFYLISISMVLIIFTIITPQYKTYSDNFARKKGQLLGLKKYIEYAEKDRIEKLVKDNPEIFFDILPYAYILDVSDKWIEMFEMQFGTDTSYYSTFVCIRMSTFSRSFRSVNTSFMQERSSQIRSRMSSSSGGGGGGSFGGGSSGGGGGGGSFGAR